MGVLKILGFLTLAVFLSLMLFSRKDKNIVFVKFILLAYPFLHLKPVGSLSCFDLVTYFFFFLLYRKREKSATNMPFYRFFFLGYIITIFTGLILSNEKFDNGNLFEVIRVFPIFIFSKILIDECLNDREFFHEVIDTLKFLLYFSFAFLAIQMVVGIKFSLFSTMNPNIMISNGIRYPSFLADPQTYSQFLGALSFLCLMKYREDDKLTYKNYLPVVFSIIAIMLAGGRAGLIGWVGGFVLFVLFSNNTYRITMLLSGGVIAGIAYAFKDKMAIFNRSTDMEQTALERLEYRLQAMQLFKEHPFFGIGLDNYAKYSFAHFPNQVWIIDGQPVPFDHPESGYFKILDELGGLGFMFYFLFVVYTIAVCFGEYFRKKDPNFVLMTSGLLAFLVGFFSTYSLGDSRIKLLLGSMLSIMIVYQQYRKEDRLQEAVE